MLELKLLGPPVMTIGGRPVVVDTRKATALLAYLAVSPGPHRRDALAALCWPDADAQRAAGALRRTLSTLRTAVGETRVRADRSSVELDDADMSVDVADAKALLEATRSHGHGPGTVCQECVAPLQRLVALHRGTFLEGFALRDSAAFDDWQFFTAEEVSRDLAGALDRLTPALVRQGDVQAAIGAARRRLAMDPLHEPAHRELIRLYAWNGEQSTALRQYRECVRVLDRELGVPPLQETTELYEEVLEHRLEPPVALVGAANLERGNVQPTVASPSPHVVPFVGREDELARLVDAIDTLAGGGLLAVVEGEAGIGKSRLIAEALSGAAGPDRRVLVARCFEGEAGLAYGVIIEALQRAEEQHGGEWFDTLPGAVAGEVSRLLPSAGGAHGEAAPPALDGPGALGRFVDSLGRALAAAVNGAAAGVLVFEDLHWADEASLEVVSHLARRLRGRPVVLVFSWRSELVPRGHPLRRLTADVARDGQVVALELPRLANAAVSAALRSVGVLRDEVVERVAEESEGLPLLVVEYARALAEEGGADNGDLPGGARDVLLGRLDGVGDMAHQLLTTAAVIGRSFELDVVTSASGRSDEEVAAALDELLGRRLVAEVAEPGPFGGDVTYDFTHAQLRKLAYDTMALARRRLLHGRVARAIEGRARRGESALAGVVAGHWAAAGDDAKAAAWQVRAGEHAASLLALPEAISSYGNALALGHPDVAGLHERLGDACTLQGRYADAITHYESAAAAAEQEATPRLEHKLGVAHHRGGRWDLAERHLERALAGLNGFPSTLRSQITVDRGLNAYRRGDVEAAASLAEEAAATAEAAGDVASLAHAANLLGLLARARGDLPGARRHLERSLAMAETLGDAAVETSALNNLALALGATGETDEALRLAGAALQRSAAVGDRHREAALHNNIADLLRASGDTTRAMEHLKRAVSIFAEVGEPGVLSPEVWKLVDW